MKLIDKDAVLAFMRGWKGETIDFVRNLPAVDAIPVKPLAQWLAGYAVPPAYALEETWLEKDFLTPDHMTRAWEHHLHTLMESGLMEEEKSE